MEEDGHLFLQIHNSIDSEVLGLINHCEFVKELMDYLEFLFFRKVNISSIFDVYKPFIHKRNKIGLSEIFFL